MDSPYGRKLVIDTNREDSSFHQKNYLPKPMIYQERELTPIKHNLPLNPAPYRAQSRVAAKPKISNTARRTADMKIQTDPKIDTPIDLCERKLLQYIRSVKLKPKSAMKILSAAVNETKEQKYESQRKSKITSDNVFECTQRNETVKEIVLEYNKFNRNYVDAVFNYSNNKSEIKKIQIDSDTKNDLITTELPAIEVQKSNLKEEVISTLKELLMSGVIKVADEHKLTENKTTIHNMPELYPSLPKRMKVNNTEEIKKTICPPIGVSAPLMINYIHTFAPPRAEYYDVNNGVQYVTPYLGNVSVSQSPCPRPIQSSSQSTRPLLQFQGYQSRPYMAPDRVLLQNSNKPGPPCESVVTYTNRPWYP